MTSFWPNVCFSSLIRLLFVYFQIQALNNDMIELRARLQKSDLEKEQLKMQIRELFDEKDNTQRHLEAISQSHESRITEMHCVIVELNKKLKVQQDTAIIEETEPEGSGESVESFSSCREP
jgi:chromosome segregation ATPase